VGSGYFVNRQKSTECIFARSEAERRSDLFNNTLPLIIALHTLYGFMRRTTSDIGGRVMIDINCHILPNLDDGPVTLKESIAMCRIAQQDGIEKIVATPHIRGSATDPNTSDIIAQTDALKAVIHQEGLSLEIIPATSIRLEPSLLERVVSRDLLMIGGSVDYCLFELPSDLVPASAERWLYKLMLKGIIPIIAHPERNLEIQRDLAKLYKFVEMGVLTQVSSLSLTGGFGKTVEQTAKEMLECRLAHLIATAAHSTNRRPPILSDALEVAAALIGKERAEAMVTTLPTQILAGELVEPETPLPVKVKRRSFWSFFK